MKKLFLVTWEGRDGDGNCLVHTTSESKALKVARPEYFRIVKNFHGEFISGATLFVHQDVTKKDLQEIDPTDYRGVFHVGVEEMTAIEA